MKTLGMTMESYGRNVSRVIVEMTADEFHLISGRGRQYNIQPQDVSAGREVEICRRYHHVMAVEQKMRDAQNLSECLAALAKMIDTQIPAMQELAADDRQETEGPPNAE
jgi:hypothetical protein